MVDDVGDERVVSWEAPGPGTWELDASHFEPTVSRIVADLISDGTCRGFTEGFELLGAPLHHVATRFVNGGMYQRLVPLVAAGKDGPPPPAWVLKGITRVHPAFRRRARQSVRALEDRIWRSEFERWEREWKPRLVERNRTLGAVDVEGLSDAELADHLDAVIDHLRWSTPLHFRLHCSDLGPIGLLLVRAEDLGLDPAAVMAALAGASPSTSEPAEALAEIGRELRSCGVTPSSLEEVRGASPHAAALLDRYVVEYGSRLTTGYDITSLTLNELPDVVLGSIVEATASPERTVSDSATERGAAALDEVLASADVADRAELTRLIEDARLLYGLRDENGPLTYEWPAGVLRRAVVEAGRRLAGSGRIESERHVFDLDAHEMSPILRGRGVPTAHDLASRHAERMSFDDLEHPPYLGLPPDDPPFDVLPGEMPTLMRSVVTVVDLLEARADVGRMSGTGIGDTSYTGTARVVSGAEEAMDRAEPGDVIVTRLTVPTFNSVLAMAGAVVTVNGGLLCHTAVIARELGIPAVVGVPGALEIPDGATVEVDPTAGVVRLVGA